MQDAGRSGARLDGAPTRMELLKMLVGALACAWLSYSQRQVYLACWHPHRAAAAVLSRVHVVRPAFHVSRWTAPVLMVAFGAMASIQSARLLAALWLMASR